MTKYVLNSGGVGKHPDKARLFMAEYLKGLGAKPRVLVCLFSRPREYWEQVFAEYEKSMQDSAPSGVTLQLELAFPKSFEKQIQNNDVIYIPGGDDHLTQYWLKQFTIPKIWEGKVVAGSSAGSDALVKHYWTCDWREVGDGLGVIPIKFIPHYGTDYGNDDPYRGPIDWEAAQKALENYGEDLPIHKPKEGDFIVINQ